MCWNVSRCIGMTDNKNNFMLTLCKFKFAANNFYISPTFTNVPTLLKGVFLDIQVYFITVVGYMYEV